jgi:HAMP domain-containing protein
MVDGVKLAFTPTLVVIVPGKSIAQPNPSETDTVFGTMLRKRLLVIYLLLVGSIVAVNVAFTLQVTSEATTNDGRTLQEQVETRNVVSTHSGTLTGSTLSKSTLVWIFVALVAFALSYIMYLLLTRIFRPLEAIVKTAREISEGNLSVSVPLERRDEIGKLGQTVNDIAVNYQEVLLFTGTKVGNLRSAVSVLEDALDREENTQTDMEVREQLEVMRRELEGLSDVVQQFRFYKARFNGSKVLRND